MRARVVTARHLIVVTLIVLGCIFTIGGGQASDNAARPTTQPVDTGEAAAEPLQIKEFRTVEIMAVDVFDGEGAVVVGRSHGLVREPAQLGGFRCIETLDLVGYRLEIEAHGVPRDRVQVDEELDAAVAGRNRVELLGGHDVRSGGGLAGSQERENRQDG